MVGVPACFVLIGPDACILGHHWSRCLHARSSSVEMPACVIYADDDVMCCTAGARTADRTQDIIGRDACMLYPHWSRCLHVCYGWCKNHQPNMGYHWSRCLHARS